MLKIVAYGLFVLWCNFFVIPTVASASLYPPGMTLEPNCPPTESTTTCGVIAPATAGINSNITSLTGLTTALTPEQGGTGLSLYTAGDLLYALSPATLTTLGIGTDGQVLKVASGTLAWGTSVSSNIADTDLTLTGNRSLSLGGHSLTFDGTTGDTVFGDNGNASIGGGLTVSGGSVLSGNFATPKGTDYATTGSQNDVNLGSGSLFRYTGAGTATFTGIAGGTDGKQIRIINASASNLTITNQDASSTPANRIITANGVSSIVKPDVLITLQYDSSTSRWRIVSQPVTDLSATAFVTGGSAFGATATLGTTDNNGLNFITGGNTRFSLAAGSATLAGSGATAITTDNSLSLSSAAGSSLDMTSGTTGTLTLDSGTTGALNIGTGANAKTITIGNGTGATALNLTSGSGGINLTGNTTITGSNTFTTGSGLTTINSTAITLAGNATVLDMSGTGALGINTTNNRAITTGSGLFTMGGGLTVAGLSTFNSNVVANGDVTLGNAISDHVTFNGTVLGAQPLVFDGSVNDSNYLTLAITNPSASHTATIPGLTGDDVFVFESQSQTLANKTFTSPVLNGSLSGTGIDIDGTLFANSDTKIASQKAVKTYVDGKVAGQSWRPAADAMSGIETDVGAHVVGQANYTIDGIPMTNGMRVFFTAETANPGTYKNKIFKVSGVGTAIVLTLETDGQAGNGDPTNGDTVYVTQGNHHGGHTHVYVSSLADWVHADSLSGTLVKTNNLSDVSNVATARTNLGLGASSSPTFAGLTIVSNGNISQTGTGTLTTGTGLFTASGNAAIVGLLTGQAGAVIAGDDITLNHDSNFNVDLATGNSTGTVAIGGGLSPVSVNSTTWDISTLGAASGFTSLSSDTATALTLDSGTTGALNIGTGSNAKTITIGNGTGATTLNLTSGSGGINLTGNTTISGSNTLTTGSGVTTINSTAITLAGNGTVLDMTGTGTLGLNTTNNRAITTGSGLFTMGGGLTVNGDLTYVGNQIAQKGADYATVGTQNDVNLGSGALFRYTGAGVATFTGIAGGTDGRYVRIMNASASNLVFANQSASSTAANRIITASGANITIAPDVSVAVQYDAGASRWRIVTLPASAASISTYAFEQSGNAFGTTATLGTTDANGLNFITSGNTRFSLASGSAILTGSGATTIASDNTLALSSAAGSALTVIASTTGALTLDSGTTGAVNLGTGSNAKTITIGNGTGATSLVLNAGTGNIDIGGNAVARTINIGTGAAVVETINVGGTGANVIGVGNTQTGGSVAIGGAMTSGTIDIGNSNGAMTGTINIGGSTGAQTLNFGGGNTGIKTINIGGGTAANVIAIGNAQTAGSVAIGNAMTTGTITIGGTGAQTGTIALGTGTGAQSINLATGAGAKTVVLGSTNGASSLALDSGTGALNIGTSISKTITLGNTTGATRVNVNAGTGGIFATGLGAAVAGNLVVCINNTTKQLFVGANNTACNTSSERFKHDIEGITLGLDAVNALRPVSFTYNSNNEKSLGFIAEEVANVDERLIVRDEQGVPFAINPDEFVPILTKAIQQVSVYIGDVSPKENLDGSNNGLSTLAAAIQSETAHDPVAVIAAKIASDKQFLADFVAARVTAIRGYFEEVFTKKVHTEELCVKKSDGSEVCVNGDQIDSLIHGNGNDVPSASAPVQDPTPAPTQTPEPIPAEPTLTSEPIPAEPTSTPEVAPVVESAPAADVPIASETPVESAESIGPEVSAPEVNPPALDEVPSDAATTQSSVAE